MGSLQVVHPDVIYSTPAKTKKVNGSASTLKHKNYYSQWLKRHLAGEQALT